MGSILMIILSTLLVLSRNTQSSEHRSTIESSSASVTSGIDDSSISTTQIPDSDGNFTTIPSCDINTSCTTEMLDYSNVTTLKPAVFRNMTQGTQLTKKVKSSGSIDFCTCNLQLNFCDINCCCDEDCSPDDKKIFDHCQVEDRMYDTRYCDYMKYIYINNTPFQWQINQNGLFCVVKSNLAPFYTIQKEHALKTFAEAESEKNKLFSWRKCTLHHADILNVTEKFAYGNHIAVIRNKKLGQLQLPNKLITNRCLIKDDVINLKNVKNKCVQDYIGEDNQYLSMKEYYQDTYVIASQSSFNLTKHSKNAFQDCPRNICLSIVPRICNEHLNTCVNVTKNDNRVKMTCNLALNRNVCVNIVTKIQYNFYHNGSSGFSQVILLAYLENLTYPIWKRDLDFSQEFSVNFWWLNQTRNFSEILSGNPGYLVGKPILIGKLVNVGNKTHELVILRRNSSRFIDNFLTIPEYKDGYCISDEMTHTVVEFGYDLLTKCKYKINIVEKKKINGTQICQDIQRSVFHLWDINEKENKTFGTFGNANSTVPDHWLKILLKKDTRSILNGTFGSYNSKSNLLSCFGIATCLDIDLFYSRIDVGSLRNQQKLLAVTYSFSRFVNKTVLLNKNPSSTVFELDLQSRVSFYDISRPKMEKMLDPPSLDIKLPYDFFYPFVKIDNGVGVRNPALSLIILISIILGVIK